MEFLPPSLGRLVRSLQAIHRPTAEGLGALVEAAGVQAVDLEAWATFDHPVRDSYGRRLVHHGGHFEVMVMSWSAGDFSAIHDHGQAEWGAVQCFGRADHTTFRLVDGVLRLEREAPYTAGMVQRVSAGMIHQMGNAGSTPLLSLHVYGRAAASANITAEARIFELQEGTIQRTDGGVFFALPEERILAREPGLRAEPGVARRHHRLKRQRLIRILERQWCPALVKQLCDLDQQLQALEVGPFSPMAAVAPHRIDRHDSWAATIGHQP